MMRSPARRIGPWRMADLEDIQPNGLRVFSCFHCGGGSTMGYRLAGFEVLGGVEIDPDMMAVYRANHRPRLSYLMAVQAFKALPDADLPPELFDLDILDGSPPCSAFSLAGSRDRKWGDAHFFREGQVNQRLDDLFFDFIDIAAKLRPRVVVAENVKGLIVGKARGYVKQIFQAFAAAGYQVQLFLLNACRMGVPQARERTFFVARRADLQLPEVALDFAEPPIPASRAFAGLPPQTGRALSAWTLQLYRKTKPGLRLCEVHPTGAMYNHRRMHPGRVATTLAANCGLYHWSEPRLISELEAMRLQTFPDDFDGLDQDRRYICGMSVPPFMMQRLALELGRQLFGVEYSAELIDTFAPLEAANDDTFLQQKTA